MASMPACARPSPAPTAVQPLKLDQGRDLDLTADRRICADRLGTQARNFSGDVGAAVMRTMGLAGDRGYIGRPRFDAPLKVDPIRRG